MKETNQEILHCLPFAKHFICFHTKLFGKFQKFSLSFTNISTTKVTETIRRILRIKNSIPPVSIKGWDLYNQDWVQTDL